MKDPIKEYIEAYREVFEGEVARRRKALELDLEVANLGADVIEEGERKLLAQHGVNIEELEKSNAQLSKQLAERVRKIDEELSHAPENFEEGRQRLRLVMQQVAACPQAKDPCIWSPPVIFNGIPGPCHNGCAVEVTNDSRLGRVYPVLTIRGTGRRGMRTGEVYCEYIWAFYTSSTGRYLVNPFLEFHGRIVQTREHHWFVRTSGTGWTYQLTMGHAQPGTPVPSPVFVDMEGTLPWIGGTFRYDGERTPNYMPFLLGGHWTYIHVGLRFRVSARSRYASVSVNFGNPRSDNYISITPLCYSVPGEWP
jgi:hypothetical protein